MPTGLNGIAHGRKQCRLETATDVQYSCKLIDEWRINRNRGLVCRVNNIILLSLRFNATYLLT